MADPSKPDEPPQGPELPSEWESDNPNDVSWITGKRRKISVLRVPPDTLPTAPKSAESKPPETDAQTAPRTDSTMAKLAELSQEHERQVRDAGAALGHALRTKLPPDSPAEKPTADKPPTTTRPAFSDDVVPPVPHPTGEDEAWARIMDDPDVQKTARDYEAQRQATARILAATRPDPKPEDPYSLRSIIMYGHSDERRKQEEELLRKREELIARDERLLEAQRQRRPMVDDVVEGILRPQRPEETRPAKPRPNPAVSEPSILAKFWKLTESNFFMGGGLGIALAAYAFLIGGAPKFAVFLLVCAWLVISVSIYRHRFFEGRKRGWEIAGNAIISLSIAVVLLGLWLLLRPSVSIPASPLQPTLDTAKPATVDTLTLRHKGAVVFANFPQPFLYEYGTPVSFLAPVGLSINIEVTNNKPIKTRINQYFADIRTADGQWHRVLNLPMYPPRTLYFLNLRDITRGMRCNFEPAIFDVIANNKNLDPGETLEGWVFFEWPARLRGTTVEVKAVRWTVKNSQGEITEAVFEHGAEASEVPGGSQVNDGGVFCTGKRGERIDLSNIPIKPLRD